MEAAEATISPGKASNASRTYAKLWFVFWQGGIVATCAAVAAGIAKSTG